MEASGSAPAAFDGQGPAGAPAPVAGAPAQGTAPGSTTPESSSSFNWDLFPNVPEDQRGALEPHLKETQGYVTKLEQSIAPFKAILESDGGPEALQGLIGFEQQFNEDPVGTWMNLAKNMIEEGVLTPEVLQTLMVPEGEQPPVVPGTVQGGEEEDDGTGEVVDPKIAELQARLDAQDEEKEEAQRARQEQVSQELLTRQTNRIVDKLAEAGLEVTDENRQEVSDSVVAHLITAQGNPEKALKTMMSVIQGSRRALETSKETQKLDLPNGVPPTGGKPKISKDPFKAASQGAQQMLERQKAAEVHN